MLLFTTWVSAQDPAGYISKKDGVMSALNLLPADKIKEYVLSHSVVKQFDWAHWEGHMTLPAEKQKFVAALMDQFAQDLPIASGQTPLAN